MSKAKANIDQFCYSGIMYDRGSYKAVISKIGGLFGLGGDDSSPINTQNATPLMNMNSNSMQFQNTNRSNNVQIDRIEVNTQATDAEGISKAMNQSLPQ